MKIRWINSIGFFYFIRFINIRKVTPGNPNIKETISEGRFIPTYMPVRLPLSATNKYPKNPKNEDEIKDENRRLDFINPYIKANREITAIIVKMASEIFIITP